MWSGISRATAWIALAAVVTGCAESPRREILLQAATENVEGWLVASGELAVFPNRPGRSYDPYSRDEGQHCVTVVPESPELRTAACQLDGKRVRVWGRPVLYSELKLGTSTHDVLLSKRYYKTEYVGNSCLRDYVFVAERVEGF